VARDRGYLIGGGYLHLFINETRAASLETGERLALFLAPDEYIFGVKPTDYFELYALYSIDQVLQAGKTYYYRLLILIRQQIRVHYLHVSPDFTGIQRVLCNLLSCRFNRGPFCRRRGVASLATIFARRQH
jgi:hypothetical protein